MAKEPGEPKEEIKTGDESQISGMFQELAKREKDASEPGEPSEEELYKIAIAAGIKDESFPGPEHESFIPSFSGEAEVVIGGINYMAKGHEGTMKDAPMRFSSNFERIEAKAARPGFIEFIPQFNKDKKVLRTDWNREIADIRKKRASKK